MDKALLARTEKQAWFHRYPRGWPLLLFALTVLAPACGARSGLGRSSPAGATALASSA